MGFLLEVLLCISMLRRQPRILTLLLWKALKDNLLVCKVRCSISSLRLGLNRDPRIRNDSRLACKRHINDNENLRFLAFNFRSLL